MAVAHVEVSELEETRTAGDRVVDACRQTAHLSHQARLLKSVAADAIEDGAYAARRAMTSVRHRVDELADLGDEALHRVKRQPVRAMAAAVGVGLAAGAVIGWVASRSTLRAAVRKWREDHD